MLTQLALIAMQGQPQRFCLNKITKLQQPVKLNIAQVKKTKVPLFGRICTSPSLCRRLKASRTGASLVEDKRVASADSDILQPIGNVPLMIISLIRR